ncbi:nitrogen fixation protein NifH [Chloroflexi bacterium TSY]|nr:nitrogen fixation protein NifH [Chloroflexi bacterium TSY]
MNWQHQLRGDSLRWLLTEDAPNVRYLALRDLMDTPADDQELLTAQQTVYKEGPIVAILAEMDEEGYWSKLGPGYTGKYRSTVWSIIALSQLGAAAAMDERIARACAYLLDHALTEGGQFTMTGAPSGTIDCLQGNLCAALVDLGYTDPRLDAAFDWMARSVIGEGVATAKDRDTPMRYYAGTNFGPRFACGYNGKKPCAWGAIKELLAFSKLAAKQRTPLIERAIKIGVDFLLSTDPAFADYPNRNDDKPSPNWWKFGFPVFYITDLLQNVEALIALGFGKDARLSHALELIRGKQDDQGRWPLEYSYSGKTWGDFGVKGQPNKWVTLRALRVLKQVA